jgi:hypothetical protein
VAGEKKREKDDFLFLDLKAEAIHNLILSTCLKSPLTPLYERGEHII